MIAAGDQHSAILTDQNELFTWGNGDYFRLGHGFCLDQLEPKVVEVLTDVYVTHVSCGTNHTLCVTNEGYLLCLILGLFMRGEVVCMVN